MFSETGTWFLFTSLASRGSMLLLECKFLYVPTVNYGIFFFNIYILGVFTEKHKQCAIWLDVGDSMTS